MNSVMLYIHYLFHGKNKSKTKYITLGTAPRYIRKNRRTEEKSILPR